VTRRLINMEMNRVEGDLEIRLEADGHTITDAWCVGTMYRGYEQILVGRDPLDTLVIAPRICGICSTSQLYAATLALEAAHHYDVAPNGTRIRNLCLMAENVMSDARHTFLMFAPDLCNEAYRRQPLFAEVQEAFAAPFEGWAAQEAVYHTKKILGVVIAFGGQWPHSTYMMPGGVTCPLRKQQLLRALTVVDEYAAWYEARILGCSSERWLALDSADAFAAWLEEDPLHASSAAGLFARFGRGVGLHRTGQGSAKLLTAGCYPDPVAWRAPLMGSQYLSPAGFLDGATGLVEPFEQEHITEHVRYSWYEDYEGGRHPAQGETRPERRTDTGKYSFAKAPRYKDQVVQVGPLADLLVAGDPLITSFFRAEGPNTWLRQFTRIHRPVVVLQQMRACILELVQHLGEPTFIAGAPQAEAEGYAFINAARGSLGHWLRVEDGKIANYQIITPTSWNGSPRDSAGRRGHWEESFLGLEVEDFDNPVEVGHVVRSHDACLVCTVHFTRGGRRHTFRA
jgi:uptake hydrogenase large subunit